MAFSNEQKEEFLALAQELEETEQKLKELNQELQDRLASFGVGDCFQDDVTKIVYKVVIPTGRFIYYKALDYIRTAKPGERSGSLSKEKAKEAGFSV